MFFSLFSEARAGSGWGCNELIHFVTSPPNETDLVITDRIISIVEPLFTLRPALLAHPITNVFISNCSLDDKAMEVFADVLIHSKTIKSLELPKNRIGPHGAAQLATVCSSF